MLTTQRICEQPYTKMSTLKTRNYKLYEYETITIKSLFFFLCQFKTSTSKKIMIY